jgi:peptidoglycan hydrolase-like protein with peptidoglycan-binding domain
MASRVISVLTTLAIVAAMVAPALAQSTGGSTGTGSAPATGSGGSTPKTPPAPSATQPSTSTPTPGTGSGTTKAKPAPSMGQSGTTSPGSGGADAEQVKSVQKALQGKGMDPGPIDGVMGPKTMAALKAFQKDQKLTESGRLDDQTREKLGVR